jgi:hypothetical protein
MIMAEEMWGKLLFHPRAEEVIREREDRLAEAKVVLGDLDALAEVQRGLAVGNWSNAREYVCTEIELRLATLRELLGAA